MSKNRNRKSQHRKQAPASSQLPKLKLTPQDMELLCQALVDYQRLFHTCFQRRAQREWSAFYLCGQLSNLERKAIEPLVLELLGPQRNVIRAVQQFIGQGHWDAETLVHRLQVEVAKTLGDPQAVLIVDGSGFPKQGEHSAGVARQYCGALGKIANCQEGVFAVYASQYGYTFVDTRLYLHETWFDSEHQRVWHACGIPKDQPFRTEPELALEMIQSIQARAVLPFQWITCDEQFGRNTAYWDGIAALGKGYFAEVPCDTRVWLRTPAIEPTERGLMGRPRTQPRVNLNAPCAQEMQTLAAALSKSAWHTFLMQEGSKGPLRAEFAFARVTTIRKRLPGPRVWAIFRRSLNAPREIKYYLSNAPSPCLPRALAQLSGMRWPVETTLEEGKGEVGMNQYETRTWRGWHHHMAQTFVAYSFLMRMRVWLRKIFGPDNGTGPQFGQRNHQRAALFAQYVGSGRLSAASQSRRLSFTSQTNPQTPRTAARQKSCHWFPHFERMLYDNAQLARVYLHAYQITGNEYYKRITIEILDYVVREMTSLEGGFYSSQDADSEGHEGKFFVWTPEEIRSALGGSTSGLLIVSKSKQDVSDAALFMDAYGVTERGNFEGKNILHLARDVDVLSAMHKLDAATIQRKLDDARQKLFNARERRIKPARDEKILTGWNGLMLAAFAEAARVLGSSQRSVVRQKPVIKMQ